MDDQDQLVAVLEDLKCTDMPSSIPNLLRYFSFPREKGDGNAFRGKYQRAKLEELITENESLRIQNLTLARNFYATRKENERLRLENATLVKELEGVKNETTDLLRRSATEQKTGKCVASDGGCLTIDVARRILETMDRIPVYVSYVDTDLRRLWCNEFAGDLNEKDMLHIQTAGLQLKFKALETGEAQRADVAIWLPNKGDMVWRIDARPHLNKEGAVVGVSMASINITEQVKLKECLCRLEAEMTARTVMENELCQAMKLKEEAIQAKNVFLAIMSHEIRTPLNGLLGLAEALENSELNAEQKELVRTILSSGVIVADILGDILDLASMEFDMMNFEEHPFSPAALVEDIIKMAVVAAHENDVTVTSEVAADVPNIVICDPLRLRQVIKYLVLNAVKFTQKGSINICMGMKSESAKKARVENKRDAKYIENAQSNEVNIVSRSEFECKSNVVDSVLKSKNSIILDTNLVQMKLSECPSRTYKDEVGYAVKLSKNVGDLQENVDELVRLPKHDAILSPIENSLVGHLELPFKALARKDQIFNHKMSSDGGGSEDKDNADNEFSYQHLLYCEITDTGIGIPMEAFGTLFDKFTQVNSGQRRNHGGTGLGLAICKQLVELMGGQLTVESKIGKGSKFTFTVKCKVSEDTQVGMKSRRLENLTLSMLGSSSLASESLLADIELAPSTDPEASSVVVQNNLKRPNPRILLAEDNKVNVMVAVSMLKRLGFTAKVVENGVEALQAIRKEKYDLILLDVCMPLMDGLQVAYAVRKFEETGQWPDGDLCNMFSISPSRSQESGNTSASQVQMNKGMNGSANTVEDPTTSDMAKHIPIIAVSANALRSEIEKCFACGMDAFISKPVVFQKLQEILERYLPQHNSS